MSYSQEYKDLHKLASSRAFSHAWRDASAWMLIAELTRRSPQRFRVFETPYVNGIPHTVWRVYALFSDRDPRGELILQINNFGSVDVPQHQHGNHSCDYLRLPRSDKDDRFSTMDLIFSPEPKRIIRELESCYRGEILPELSPPTVPETIGHRVIGSALALFLHSKRPLRVSGYLYDGVSERTDLSKVFPALEFSQNLEQVFFLRESGPNDVGEFDSEGGAPILAIDLALGMAYTQTQVIDLMQRFIELNRNIESLAFTLVQEARK